jgi:hypothetical protein
MTRGDRVNTLGLIAIALIVVCGTALRARGMSKSLWADEAWVANSTLEKTLAETIHYSAWLQTSPPGFLIMVRWANGVLRLSNASLRVVPLLSGVASLVCMAYLSFKLLPPLAAIWGLTLFCLSPLGIYYSHVLKQYSSELACSVVLLTAVWSYMSSPCRWRYILLLAMIVASIVTAYGILYFVPGLIVLLSPLWRDEEKESGRGISVSRWPVIIVTILLASSGVYWGSIRPNHSDSLAVFFWAHRRLDGTYTLMKYVYTKFQEIQLLIPIPVAFERVDPVSDRLLACGLLAFGICGIVFAVGGKRKRRFLALMCGAPCGVALLLDLLHVYPLSNNGRTGLILLPCVALAFASCLEVITLKISETFSPRTRWQGITPRNRYAISTGVLLIVLTSSTGVKDALRDDRVREDMAGAVQFVFQNSSPSDFVFVHASCEEAFRLYARMYDWSFPSTVRFGDTGWPCCPRRMKATGSSKNEVLQNFITNIPPGNNERVWFLATERDGHWAFVGLDEPALLTSALLAAGCEELPTQLFTNIRLASFACSSYWSASIRNIDIENK